MTPTHNKILSALALLMGLALISGGRVRQGNAMQGQQINRVSSRTLVVLSLIALFAVVGGYFFQAPRGDEGPAAHIFQLAVVAALLVGALFIGTAKWSEGWRRTARPLAMPAAVLALAFGTLCYLEHYYR